MELVKGVRLHFIKSKKYKTNKIRIRFAAPMSEETVAGRVLVATMLETANQEYPTSQAFRERLATLYGANYSTSVSRRGLVHYVDINVSFVRDEFLSRKNVLTGQLLDFLKASLFSPLVHGRAFDQKVFELEKKNVITDLEAEIEDHFYHAHLELNKLFYHHKEMQIPRVGTVDLVRKETPETSFALFQKMLKEDQMDLFFVGDFNEIAVREALEEFHFQPREQVLHLQYQQECSNVVAEGLERKESNQSILELGYFFPITYGEKGHLPLLIANGLLGGFAHSKLFVNVREKESLAYTISSQFDIFSGFLRIYAGIDRRNRAKVLSLINRQLSDLKRGRFAQDELEQTKNMLKNSMLLAQDRQNTLLERAYMSSMMGRKFLSVEAWIKELDGVTKEEVVEAVKTLKLQAIYFMEGK